MSFEVDVGVHLGDRWIEGRFASDAPLVALFGSSGTGKTTILNMIAGLLTPGWGRIAVGGRVLAQMSEDPWEPDYALPPEQRRVGYVFQDSRLFPHLRVRDNLTYGRPNTRSFRAKSRNVNPSPGFSTALETNESFERIAFLGIDHLLDRWPRTLSGGEARRVAIGRALLSEPDFLLLDEPLSSLDRARREEVMTAIEHLRDHAGLPILLVTHDRAEAERLGTMIVELG